MENETPTPSPVASEQRIALIKGHAQKLVKFLEHAQSRGCFTLAQSSQIYAILLEIKQS